MIWLIYFLNLGISVLNAWSCGRSWNETKRAGGFAHFMNWMGATMAACGFTWCLLVLTTQVGIHIPGKYHLPANYANGTMALGYLVLIVPIIGSGLAITIQSWAYFWKERNFKNGAVAGWNTFAQVYNVVEAARGIPMALQIVGELFNPKTIAEDDGIKTYAVKVVIGLVVFSLVGGILTTVWIISATAKGVAYEEMERARKQAAESLNKNPFGNRRWA